MHSVDPLSGASRQTFFAYLFTQVRMLLYEPLFGLTDRKAAGEFSVFTLT